MAVARTHTGAAKSSKQPSIVYAVLLPLTKRGTDLLSPSERLAVAARYPATAEGRGTTVMEPFHTIPEMFDAAEEMGIRLVLRTCSPRRMPRPVRWRGALCGR
jgi:hypothetical protein